MNHFTNTLGQTIAPDIAARLARSLHTLTVGVQRQNATRVADALKRFAMAPSLGGIESLVTQHCTTTKKRSYKRNVIQGCNF